MRYLLLLTIVALLLLLITRRVGNTSIDPRVVANFELTRYMGDWYEIARFDHAFERGLDRVKASYELQPSGRVAVINSGVDRKSGERKTARGRAYATSVPGKLKVSFFWIFYSDYNVLELDENYQWALVGSRSPKYLWVLARKPRLPAATLNHILDLARKRGYPVEQLLFSDF